MNLFGWISASLVHTLFICICGSVDPNHLVEEIQIPIEAKPRETPTQRGCRKAEKDPTDKEFRIAWLAPRQEYHNFSAATSVGAMKLALAYIDQHMLLKHGWKVR